MRLLACTTRLGLRVAARPAGCAPRSRRRGRHEKTFPRRGGAGGAAVGRQTSDRLFHNRISSNSSGGKSITPAHRRTYVTKHKELGCIERSKAGLLRPLLRERRGCGFLRGRRSSAFESLLGPWAARRGRAAGVTMERLFPVVIGVVRAARRSGGGAREIDLVSESRCHRSVSTKL